MADEQDDNVPGIIDRVLTGHRSARGATYSLTYEQAAALVRAGREMGLGNDERKVLRRAAQASIAVAKKLRALAGKVEPR